MLPFIEDQLGRLTRGRIYTTNRPHVICDPDGSVRVNEGTISTMHEWYCIFQLIHEVFRPLIQGVQKKVEYLGYT